MHGTDPIKFWFLAACLAAAALYSFWYCFVSWRKNRVVGDTPTSRVRSAAQGYVEFTGHGSMPPDTEIRAPLSGLPCTWWRYKIEERSSSGRARSWTTVQSDTSAAPFILDDGSGRCLVDPRGAEVFPSANDVWYGSSEWPEVCIPNGPGVLGWLSAAFAGGNYRYTEHRLQQHEQLYAIGSFHTLGGVSVESPDRAVAALLRDWKHDQKALLERFDADRDGVLSPDEWDKARSAAREQVASNLASAAAPELNVLSKPTDGRSFMLAACDEQTLARRMRLRAAAGITAFVGSSFALTWMLTRL
ncbi:MAG: hypothetical protein JWN43_3042 [Gammaproteobacteria bacterium]|nr:hypothetical protein [Gammaproteobacteria bacterium]